jgi:hypothetical protein
MKRIALALATLLVCASASAQDYARTGIYAQLNGVSSWENFDHAPNDLFDTAVGVSGRLGYRFDPSFALEAQVQYSGDFVDCCGGDLTLTTATLNGKVFLLRDRVQPFALAGFGVGHEESNITSDDTGPLFRFGGGLDVYVGRNWGVTGEVTYNVPFGHIDDFDHVSLGWGVFARF